jgi:hypothetical protein
MPDDNLDLVNPNMLAAKRKTGLLDVLRGIDNPSVGDRRWQVKLRVGAIHAAMSAMLLSGCASGFDAQHPIRAAFDNEPAGFRNIAWETPISQVHDVMTFMGADKK